MENNKKRSIDDILTYLKSDEFATELDASQKPSVEIKTWVKELENIWKIVKNNPVEWCNCDKCVCKTDKNFRLLKDFTEKIRDLNLDSYDPVEIDEVFGYGTTHTFIDAEEIEDLKDKAWHAIANTMQ